MNDLDLCLEVASRSCQVVNHCAYIRRWISRKPLEIEAWFQRTTNRKRIWAIKWSRDRWRHVTLKSQTRDSNTLKSAISRKWLEIETPLLRSKGLPLGNGAWAMATKWSRDRWRHVTPKVPWGSTVGYSDSLASCSSNTSHFQPSSSVTDVCLCLCSQVSRRVESVTIQRRHNGRRETTRRLHAGLSTQQQQLTTIDTNKPT